MTKGLCIYTFTCVSGIGKIHPKLNKDHTHLCVHTFTRPKILFTHTYSSSDRPNQEWIFFINKFPLTFQRV